MYLFFLINHYHSLFFQSVEPENVSCLTVLPVRVTVKRGSPCLFAYCTNPKFATVQVHGRTRGKNLWNCWYFLIFEPNLCEF